MNITTVTVLQWLNAATSHLTRCSSARLDAEVILAHSLGQSRTALFAWPDKIIEPDILTRLAALLQRRKLGEPLAYLIGEREFWSFSLYVSPAVLVPRPETECLVEMALAHVEKNDVKSILDAGTGSGAIGVALARECTISITASDISSDALAIAQHNMQRLAPERIQFVRGDWLQPFADHSFDMIISNPPYVAASDPHLLADGLQFEPNNALSSGIDGLDALRQLVNSSGRVGKPGCRVLFEHGYEQASRVRALLQQHGYTHIETKQDLAGLDRVTLATTIT